MEEKRNLLPNKWDREVDIIIVGAGSAGLIAAIEAADAGANVLVLEKMRGWGGASLMAGNKIAATGTRLQKEQGVKDSVELFYQNAMECGQYLNIEELTKIACELSGPTMDWLADMGMRCDLETAPDHTYLASYAVQRIHYLVGRKGEELIRVLGDGVKQRNIPVLLETPASKLLVEPATGRVVGVEAREKRRPINIKAKAVILASGGYAGSQEMIERFNPGWKGATRLGGHAGCTGDGLLMAMKIGADVTHIPYMGLREGMRGVTNGTIFVNSEGRRFVNEDIPGHLNLLSPIVDRQPGSPFYTVIMDSVTWDHHLVRSTREDIYGLKGENVLWRMPMEPDEAVKKGIVKRESSIGELATQLGINSTNLEETVSKYNGYVEAGHDLEFGAKTLKRKIATPPFYGWHLQCHTNDTDGGLRIDKDGRVLDVYHEPIPGLYAAGEVVGGIVGFNALTGFHFTHCLVFGRIAGKTAVEAS